MIKLLVTTPSTVNEFSDPLAPLTWMPPSTSPAFTEGEESARFWNVRPFGMRSNSSALTLCAIVVLRVSMSGDSAVTLTASDTPPIFSEESTVIVLPRNRFTSGNSVVAKPDSSTFTE